MMGVLTGQQKMQIRRQIASKWGLDKDSITITKIVPRKGSTCIDGGRVLIEILYRHDKVNHCGIEVFNYYPPDLRRCPCIVYEGGML
jgi:hypothetical protein